MTGDLLGRRLTAGGDFRTGDTLLAGLRVRLRGGVLPAGLTLPGRLMGLLLFALGGEADRLRLRGERERPLDGSGLYCLMRPVPPLQHSAARQDQILGSWVALHRLLSTGSSHVESRQQWRCTARILASIWKPTEALGRPRA